MILSEEFKINKTLTEQHGVLKSRMARLYADINQVSNLVYKVDLLKMYKGANDLWAKLDNELIACRAWHKLTPAYHTLAQEIESRIEYMNKRIVWSKMM